jgi:membrane fusion protein, heavy metal efflux system
VVVSDVALRRQPVRLIRVGERRTQDDLAATGVVSADENNLFHISAFTNGRVVEEFVTLGSTIHQGQTLAVVQNLDVVKIQADYIHQMHQNQVAISQAKTRLQLAQQNFEREGHLLAEGITPRKDYYQAQADLALAASELRGQQEHATHLKTEARAMLSAYGMRPGAAQDEHIQTGSPVTAPRAGVITKKTVTRGDMVGPTTVMYEVTDLSAVWVDVTIYPSNLPKVYIGQEAVFTTDALPGKTFRQTITYLSPSPSDLTKAYTARMVVPNPERWLRPGMFCQVRLRQRGGVARVFVPHTALQHYGREAFVFVPTRQGNQFKKQLVTVAVTTQDGALLSAGLKPGQVVVGEESFTLKAELLKRLQGDEGE